MYKLKVSKTSKLEEHEVHMKYINKLIDLIGGKNVGATGAYADGRASDSWVGIGADKVFGLFGCKTMSEMETKLGNQAQNAKDLVNIANHIKSAKTNAEKAKFMQQFKVKYKAIFGVDYNPQVMTAREELQDKVAQVQINKSLQPVFNKALGTKDISSMKKVIEDCKIVMGKDDKTKKNIYLADIINMQVDPYMQAKLLENSKHVRLRLKYPLPQFLKYLFRYTVQLYRDMLSFPLCVKSILRNCSF